MNQISEKHFQMGLKRGLDVLVSVPLLFLGLPFLPIVSILIWLDSRGPVFYTQVRIGKGNRPFLLIKFRTMGHEAEQASGPTWSKRADPRATRVGGWFRRMGIDELPQLWNVLIGDMSLVGPRPERPFFADQFERDIPDYAKRHSMKPGITGWAQINGFRGDTPVIERTRYDLEYIRLWSLFMDFNILIRTPFTVELRDRGKRKRGE